MVPFHLASDVNDANSRAKAAFPMVESKRLWSEMCSSDLCACASSPGPNPMVKIPACAAVYTPSVLNNHLVKLTGRFIAASRIFFAARRTGFDSSKPQAGKKCGQCSVSPV